MFSAKRFIGIENLPSRLSEYNVQEAFALSQDAMPPSAIASATIVVGSG